MRSRAHDRGSVRARSTLALDMQTMSLTPIVPHIRIARPVTSVHRSAVMYCAGLGLKILSEFKDHSGFDGAMVGLPGGGYHLEFVHSAIHQVTPEPTAEDLLVFYIPSRPEWERTCEAMTAAGFESVEPLTPYWRQRGRTFGDHDGYRTVIECNTWSPQTP